MDARVLKKVILLPAFPLTPPAVHSHKLHLFQRRQTHQWWSDRAPATVAMLAVASVACYLFGQLLSNLLQLLPGCHRVSAPRCIEEYEWHLCHAPKTLHLVYLTQVEVDHRGIVSEEPHRRSRWCHHILSPAVKRWDLSVIGSKMALKVKRQGLTSFVCNLLQVSILLASLK